MGDHTHFESNPQYNVYQKPLFEYTEYSGANAYADHGGVPIGDDTPVPKSSGSIEECKAYCDSDADCSCVTFQPSNGNCWKRSNCNADEFESDSNYNVYFKGGKSNLSEQLATLYV